MDREPYHHVEHEPSKIAKIGRWIIHAFHDAKEQLSTADLNPHEGRLRASAAPSEYLPNVPDFPPLHDDTIQ